MPTTSSMHCSPSTAGRPTRPSIRCRPIACAGSTSSASTNCAGATCPRRRVVSTCIAARSSASWPSARRSKAQLAVGWAEAPALSPDPRPARRAEAHAVLYVDAQNRVGFARQALQQIDRTEHALSPSCRASLRRLRPLLRVGLEQQLLDPPVEDFGDIDLVLRRAGDLVDPAELLELLARLTHPAEHLAVERDLVDPAREGIGDEHYLVWSGRDADRPGRVRRLGASLRVIIDE